MVVHSVINKEIIFLRVFSVVCWLVTPIISIMQSSSAKMDPLKKSIYIEARNVCGCDPHQVPLPVEISSERRTLSLVPTQ